MIRLSLRRHPDVALDGQAYALTVFTPIRPGREEPLRDVLAGLGAGGRSPFERVPTTHVARFVVIDRLPHVEPARRPALRFQHLLFSTVFDSALDRHLAELCRRIPDAAEAVWGNCLGAPRPVAGDPDAFAAWIRRSQAHTAAFFAPYGQATVADVRAALDLRARLEQFARETQYLEARDLQARFERTFVEVATGRPR